ncbi:efflux pump antibiotic resistance protein [Aspergillus ustus]|uniref:Efflux pump antibiotic resistance protein n=1 Tax=Aspergillus ustus TaxID=40382 RepID=A0A0C1EGA5_ASPUT|nr:efflux pump antibiotic resistance protein [Aspergillus ustus]
MLGRIVDRLSRNSLGTLSRYDAKQLSSTEFTQDARLDHESPEQLGVSQDMNLASLTDNKDESTYTTPDQSDTEPQNQPEYPVSWKLVLIVIGLGLGVLCMSLDNTILATAIPRITDDFSSLEDMGWYASAYMLAQCSITLVFGKLYTLYPIKWVYLTLQWGGTKYTWDDGRIIALIVVSGVLVLVFCAVERWQQDRATIPPLLIKDRNVWASVLFAFCITGSFIVFTYYLPIWFQSVKGASATKSGIMNIPLVLSFSITSIVSGWAVTKVGYYMPLMYASTVVASIGAGLLSRFQVDSRPPTWIGYQAIFGIGVGLGFGLPVTVVQAVLPGDRISSATALIAFTQSISGALFIFVGQSVFQTRLTLGLLRENLDARMALESGATRIRETIPPDMVPVALQAYNFAITGAFYVGLALAAASLVGAVPQRWLSVKGKKIEPGVA